MAPLRSKARLAVYCTALLHIGGLNFSTALVENAAEFLGKAEPRETVEQNGGENLSSGLLPEDGFEEDDLQEASASGFNAQERDENEGEVDADGILGGGDILVRRLMGLEFLKAKNQFQQHDELEAAYRRLSATDNFEEGTQKKSGMSGESGGKDHENKGLNTLFEDQNEEGAGKSAQPNEEKLVEFFNKFLSQLGTKDVPEEELRDMIRSVLTLFKVMSQESRVKEVGEDFDGGVKGRRVSSKITSKEAKRGHDATAESTDTEVSSAEGGYDEASQRVKAAAKNFLQATRALIGGLGDVAFEGPIREAKSATTNLMANLRRKVKAAKGTTQDTTEDLINRLTGLLKEAWQILARINPKLMKSVVEARREMEKQIENAVEEEDSLG